METVSTQCIKDAVEAAGRFLGYSQTKSHQLQVLESFLKGHDVFGILPTGYGKTFCYVCLPLVFNQLLQKPSGYSIVMVVSPLVALTRDQVGY